MNIGLDSEKIPGSHNGQNKMNFLKLGGTFTPTDLEKLISDFTRAMATYQSSGFDRDTLGKISNYKDITDKMYRTNMIDDETVSKIITDFNTNFGPTKDSIYSPLVSFKSQGSVY
jgi:oligoendopeptidase F